MFLQLAVRVWPPFKPRLEHDAPKSPPPWLHRSCPLLLAIFSLRSNEVGLELPLTVAQLADRVVPLSSSAAHEAAKLHYTQCSCKCKNSILSQLIFLLEINVKQNKSKSNANTMLIFKLFKSITMEAKKLHDIRHLHWLRRNRSG